MAMMHPQRRANDRSDWGTVHYRELPNSTMSCKCDSEGSRGDRPAEVRRMTNTISQRSQHMHEKVRKKWLCATEKAACIYGNNSHIWLQRALDVHRRRKGFLRWWNDAMYEQIELDILRSLPLNSESCGDVIVKFQSWHWVNVRSSTLSQ